MAQTRTVPATRATAKPKRHRFVIDPPGKLRADQIVRRGLFVAKLLQVYAKAVDDAGRSGQSMQINITVAPEAATTTVEVSRPEMDSLDAALIRAEERGASAVAQLLSADDMLSSEAFADRIGTTRETVRQKRRRGEVLGLEGAKRGVRFPIWQLLDGHRLLPGLPQLFTKFGGQPWAVYRFLLQAHPELGGESALNRLKAGQLDEVLSVADNVAHGVPA
jgi:hypothetical protein